MHAARAAKPLWLVIALCAVVLAGLTVGSTAQARTQFVINVTPGSNDHAEGEGGFEYCEPSGEPFTTAECPIRAALEEANSLLGKVADEEIVVQVPAGHYMLSFENGLPLGASSAHRCSEATAACAVGLRGAGAGKTVIETFGAGRVIQVNPEASAPMSLEDVTIGPGDLGIDDETPNTPLTLRHTVVSGDAGNSGMRIYNSAHVDILDSAFIGDSNSTTGGAIDISASTVHVVRSTLSGNEALFGGAMRILGASASVTLVDSTVANNTANAGGAISGKVVLRHDTVAGNKAKSSGGGVEGAATLEGTILSGNSPGQCEGGGPLTMVGANVVFGPSTCPESGSAPVTADPRLAPLAANGGFAETMALLPGSPALNAAGASCPGAAPEFEPALDERGFSRPQGAACDIGAFESAADGAVSLSASPDPVAPGGTLSLTATARNAGAETVTGVQLTIAIPAGTSAVSASAGCVATLGAGAAVTCPVGELAPGQTKTALVQVRPEHTGALAETASVAIAQADFNTADDTATIASVVGATTGTQGSVAGSALKARVIHVDRHGVATVALTCPAGAPGGCRDVLDLYGLPGRLPARATARARLLASAHVLVAAGSSKRVRMRLTASVRRLLPRGHRLKARALLTASPGTGAGSIFTSRTAVTLVRAR